MARKADRLFALVRNTIPASRTGCHKALSRLKSLADKSRHSLRTRLALSLAGLSLSIFAVLGLSGLVIYEATLSHIVRWHMDPILRTLAAQSRAGADPTSVQETARAFQVWWYCDSDIPAKYRPGPGEEELVRIDRESYAYVAWDQDGHVHAVVGRVKDLDDIEDTMLFTALILGAACLLAALGLSWWLTRRLVTPLVTLTRGVRSGKDLEDTGLCGREDEVGELARAFVERERSLKAFLVREQLFTGDVSHELRTPLTVLQGGAEILESRLDDDTCKSVLARMQRTITAMTATVGTMLLLARKPEQLEFRSFDMAALARREGEFALGLVRGRPVCYEARLPDTLMVRGNADLAALVLHNLLDNACRYTETGRVVLTLTRTGFAVQDTGRPIDEEVRRRMFERGTRGTGTVPGSGLGLSLVERGCERLGWSVGHTLWEGGNVFAVSFAAADNGHTP